MSYDFHITLNFDLNKKKNISLAIHAPLISVITQFSFLFTGSSFPHKPSSNSFRPPVIKEHFRTPTGPHRPHSPPSPPPSHDFFSSPVSHVQSSNDNRGPIHEIPAPNLGPKPVGHPELYKNKIPEFHFGKGSSHDIPKPIKESFPSEHGPSYEVTENNHSSNDHVVESHDGSKLYYAPDPDPSLPVHKVPPTKDPYSIPSHGKKVLEDFSLHGSQDFQILHGGSVSSPVAQLSPQELFNLMNGHGGGALLQQQGALGHQQVVALLGQPQQPSNLILPPEAQHGHYQQQSVNDIERYLHQSQSQHGGNDVNQYLQHPEIHNALHTAQQQQGIVHMAMIDHLNAQQSLYPQQENQYQIQVPNFNNPQYQSFNYDEKDPSAGAIPMESHQAPQISNNYHFEPEASETRNSMTVIRQTDNSDSIKQLLLNDLANNVAENQIEDSDDRQQHPQQTGQIFEHRPEVPFYTTLPSREAAEALATLQAAGSIASNYVDKIKNIRGDQQIDQDNDQSPKEEKVSGPLGLPEEQLLKPQKISYFQESEGETEHTETEAPNTEEKNVEVQKSIPIYEASYVSSGIGDPQNEEVRSDAQEEGEERREEEKSDQLDFRQDDEGQKFGRRIRPK